MERLTADVVVAGGGVGGLLAAHSAAASGARVVLLEGSPGASHHISSINAAFGGVEEDQPARLFDDMFRAGNYINDPRLAARISRDAGRQIERLAAMGVPFARDGEGFARRRAAGSTWTRAVFTEGMVGSDISTVIQRELDSTYSHLVTIVTEGWLVDLSVIDGAIEGALAYAKRDAAWLDISAPAVVLATGGAGRLFAKSTNQPGSRGAGYVMAAEAGAVLKDLEFVSFEPFVLIGTDSATGRSLPTTVMSEGARLVNAAGEQFLGERPMPTKDVVARAMVREVAEGRGTPGGAVIYDFSDVEDDVLARYAKIGQSIRAAGSRRLEVMPAQHYVMGGIATDDTGATAVPGLFAVGEAAAGAHGAHRLAGGGGSEVVAMGPVAGEASALWARSGAALRVHLPPRGERPEALPFHPDDSDRAWTDRVRAALDASCGVLRTGAALEAASAELAAVDAEVVRAGRSAEHVGRTVLLARGIVAAASAREESRGDHFRVDHPERDDLAWLGNLEFTLPPGGRMLESRFAPLRLR